MQSAALFVNFALDIIICEVLTQTAKQGRREKSPKPHQRTSSKWLKPKMSNVHTSFTSADVCCPIVSSDYVEVCFHLPQSSQAAGS